MDEGAFQGGVGIGNFIKGFAMPGNDADTGAAPGFGGRMKAGMMSASEGYDKFVQQQQQITSLGKAADYFRDAMGDDAAKQTGITDEEWENMGHKDRASAMVGFMNQQTNQEAQSRAQAYSSMAQSRAATQQEQDNEAGGLARWANEMDKQINPPTPSDDDDSGTQFQGNSELLSRFSPEQRSGFHALAQMGQSSPRLAAPLLKNIFAQFAGGQMGGGKDDGTNGVNFTEDPETGDRFATFGKEMVGSGINPKKLAPNIMSVDDGQGGTLQVMLDPKTGRGTIVKPNADKGELTDQDEFKSLNTEQAGIERNPMLQNSPSLEGRLDEINARKKEMLTKGKNSAVNPRSQPPAPAGLPLPLTGGGKPDAGKLEKGKTYQTRHGAATWDGNQFSLVKPLVPAQ